MFHEDENEDMNERFSSMNFLFDNISISQNFDGFSKTFIFGGLASVMLQNPTVLQVTN